jgi:hypothetical protein
LSAARVIEAWTYLESQGLPAGGSRDVVVAIIDSGVDYTHPDLAANIWTNSREIAENGVDDDANGYVDDVHGCNVVGESSNHSGDPTDDHGHGTHVAGVIAAQAHNGVGGVGVAYNVQIMPIKAAQLSGLLAASDIAEAIHYAVAQGADVINMSFGGYAKSQVEEDALAVAFGQCVLVASAGNDGLFNERTWDCDPLRARAMYPAAYNWVLGVMASAPNGSLAEFSNRDCIPHNEIEYELIAPGVDVWSALPGGQYAAWDGTSMAAPIVSGIAALARTKWSDKDLYSSRFIMGQVAANASPLANALNTLSVTPKPELSYLQHWLFDTSAQDAGNDSDGIVDAGETVDLAIVIRNRWGQAGDAVVTLEPIAAGTDLVDPYVTMHTSVVDYGAVGAFTSDDNGLIRDGQGLVTGVQHPFRFHVQPNTPNDHVIPFRLTITARNGLDPGDATVYATTSRFSLVVQRGSEVPRVISSDLTLTKDYYWIIPDQTLIQAGATLTVTEGTQVQFFTSAPNGPYGQAGKPAIQVEGKLVIRGTALEPVELFPDSAFLGYPVYIFQAAQGISEMSYARIRNPQFGRYWHPYSNVYGLSPITEIDHCHFSQDLEDQMYYYDLGRSRFYLNVGAAEVWCERISDSIFRRVGGYWYDSMVPLGVDTPVIGNLYDGCVLSLTTGSAEGNVFLKNFKGPGRDGVIRASKASGAGTAFDSANGLLFLSPISTNRPDGDMTYVLVSGATSFDMAELFARSLGGHLAAIGDAAENEFLRGYLNWLLFLDDPDFNAVYPDLAGKRWTFPCCGGLIGLKQVRGIFSWTSGEPVTFENWGPGQGGLTPYARIDSGGGRWYGTGANGDPKILEIPGLWTREQLIAARQAYVAGFSFNQFKNNAILNVWRDPNVEHWMRFIGQNGRDTLRTIVSNYWGTTSTSLIDAAIYDFNDDFNLNRCVYEPILTEPPTSAYPFVAGVKLSTASSADASVVGAEAVTFTVKFNRDMDPAVQPQVSFGPDTPATDYTVDELEGGWQNPRTWVGTFNVTATTGDGIQLIRVAGAVAADDPWLVTGDDSGRFGFEIITSGTESMNLQATGGEGKVMLAWMQDDFEMLAGYNLYRSISSTGTFTRLNSSIIPVTQRTWQDTEVQPGQPYYYKFTVVKTDMSESDFSNMASGTPLDTIPPVIAHNPLASAPPGLALTFSADVTDNVAVQSVTLLFRPIGGTSYFARAMTRTTGDRYSATIEGSKVTLSGLEYYLEASDGISTAQYGRAELPFQVGVENRPVVTAVSPVRGPATGGIAAVLSGANFQAGARVRFGSTPAGNVVVEDANRISCTTPAHFPAIVDVTVENVDSTRGSLLRGFTFYSDVAKVSLPNTGGGLQSIVAVPVNGTAISGLAAVDLMIAHSGTLLHVREVRPGNLTPGWTLQANTFTPGEIRLSMSSPAGTVEGSGVLAVIEFEVMGPSGASCPLQLTSLRLNGGAIAAQTEDGFFVADSVYVIEGAVRYWNGSNPVANAALLAKGERQYRATTGADGGFRVEGLPRGSYSLKPSKLDGVSEITAYDAALVLQHAVGLTTLSGYAARAADVDKSGTIDAMDAFYILKKAVDLILLPFPGAGVVWEFEPAERSYGDLTTGQTGQDLTAVLLGDVSGNWSTPAEASPGSGLQGGPSAGATAQVVLGTDSVANPVTGLTEVEVRLRSSLSPVNGLDLRIGYADGAAQTISAQAGDATMAANTAESGVVRAGVASAEPLTTDGMLLRLKVTGTGDPAVQIASAVANEGALVTSIASREFRLSLMSGVAGGLVSAPVTFEAQGNENALGFSLSFDPAVLTFVDFAPGDGAVGANLSVNSEEAGLGRVGVALALGPGATFVAGASQVAVASFRIAASAAEGWTTLSFSDQPVRREVSDAQAVALGVNTEARGVTLVSGYEADVAPRSAVNGLVTVSDWVQVGRFAAGLDLANVGSEFQRADCAPRMLGGLTVGGNGQITVSDWVQAGRYAAGLDPVTPMAGPTEPASTSGDMPDGATSQSSLSTGLSLVKVGAVAAGFGEVVEVPVEVHSSALMSGVGFSLVFDAQQVQFVGPVSSGGSEGSKLMLNDRRANEGELGLALAGMGTDVLPTGSRALLTLQFRILPGTTGRVSLALGDRPVTRECVDISGRPVAAAFLAGEIRVGGVPEALEAPVLRVIHDSVGILLSWTADTDGAVVEGSASLAAPNWQVLDTKADTLGGQHFLRIVPQDNQRFFRLRSGAFQVSVPEGRQP